MADLYDAVPVRPDWLGQLRTLQPLSRQKFRGRAGFLAGQRWGRIAIGIAIIAVINAGWFCSQALRWEARYRKTLAKFDHAVYRVAEIRAALNTTKNAVVVLGDSITEWAPLPGQWEGHPVINAGVAGADLEHIVKMVPMMFEKGRPATIIITLGMNNRGATNVTKIYGTLVASLKEVCPNLIAVAVTPADGSDAVNAQIKTATDAAGISMINTDMPNETTDGVHPNKAGYAVWVPAVMRAAGNRAGDIAPI